jgi:hypothetical protein
LGLGLPAEDGGGDDGDSEVDGEGFDEGVECVDEGVLVELLGVADGGDFGLDGFGGAGGGLSLLDELGEVAVHDAMHEVEVDDLPRDDVDGAGDEGDADADGEAPAEGDGPAGEVIAVGADAEEDEERDEDDGGIAEHQPPVAMFEVFEEGKRGDHQDRGENAGDEAEGEDGFLQCEAPVEVDLKTLCGAEAGFVVMLLGDFEVGWGKSCFGVRVSSHFAVTAPKPMVCGWAFVWGTTQVC